MSVKFNSTDIVRGRFPNNETDYRNLKGFIRPNINVFELIFESNEDLFNLQIVKKWLDDEEPGNKSKLLIRFFPYAQMDRKMDTHLFSLKYVTQLINELHFDNVQVFDPHSLVLPALLQHCEVVYPVLSKLYSISDPTNETGRFYDLIFYPDNGAAKKYGEIIGWPYKYGHKKRNLDTGAIEKYELVADNADIEGRRILIVDDLVMGGRTFTEAARALRKAGAQRIDLYVTHLMPQARNFYLSRGDGLIDNIYSADTLDVIKTFTTPEPRP